MRLALRQERLRNELDILHHNTNKMYFLNKMFERMDHKGAH